jgi:hypothetical protein
MEGKERSDCGRVRPRQSALKKKQEEYEKRRINVLDTSTVEKEEKGKKEELSCQLVSLGRRRAGRRKGDGTANDRSW